MDLLERLRVFSPDVIYTMPYFSWERLTVLILTLAIVFACAYSHSLWFQAIAAFTRGIPWLRNAPLHRMASSAMGRRYYGVIFGMLAGGLYGTALLSDRYETLVLSFDGFVSFSTLGPAGWAVMASAAILVWLALPIIFFGIAHAGLILGLIDACFYLAFITAAFMAGVVLGPLAILFCLRPSTFGDPNASLLRVVGLFLAAPFHGLSELLGFREPRLTAAGTVKPPRRNFLSISEALKLTNVDK